MTEQHTEAPTDSFIGEYDTDSHTTKSHERLEDRGQKRTVYAGHLEEECLDPCVSVFAIEILEITGTDAVSNDKPHPRRGVRKNNSKADDCSS